MCFGREVNWKQQASERLKLTFLTINESQEWSQTKSSDLKEKNYKKLDSSEPCYCHEQEAKNKKYNEKKSWSEPIIGGQITYQNSSI